MGVVVEIASGRIEGVQSEGHQFFRGIPYADPPVGARRFAAPQPVTPWAGVRSAEQYGPGAPQPPSLLPGMAPGPQDEDCLTLNVYTPAADGARRPVMVWIHGGGFTGGSSQQALYEGDRLTRRGEIVLVTINYRLGALGYLHLADCEAQLPGAVSNAGQRDQIAALEWVRENIDRFGGDPRRVTIFGESAGGMAVSTLMATPSARGLFQAVIAQSGAAQSCHTVESATRVRELLLSELGLATKELSALRSLPTDTLIEAQLAAGRRVGTSVFLPYAPVIDGDSIPQAPLAAIRAGSASDVALMVGTTRDEWKLFSAMDPRHFKMDQGTLTKIVDARLQHLEGTDRAHLLELYGSLRPDAPAWDVFDALETDRRFRIPAIQLAEAQCAQQPATYKYLFSWASPARRGVLGSCHALELPFVFGTLDAPTMDRFAGAGPEAEALSQAMMDAWLSFAHRHDPNCEALPRWSAYGIPERATMVLDREPALCWAPGDEERAAWETLPLQA